MFRGKRLSPLQADIYSQLDDAHEEELVTAVNCLPRCGAAYPAKTDVLPSVRAALRDLCDIRMIDLATRARPGFKVLTSERLEEALSLESWLVWEPNGSYWRGTGEFAEVYIVTHE